MTPSPGEAKLRDHFLQAMLEVTFPLQKEGPDQEITLQALIQAAQCHGFRGAVPRSAEDRFQLACLRQVFREKTFQPLRVESTVRDQRFQPERVRRRSNRESAIGQMDKLELR